MAKKVKAVVIKGNNVKEKDKNILLFSLEEGKIWATLKGVRGDKAKLKYAKEPFCFGEFLLEEGKGSLVVTSVDILESFNELSQDVEKYFEGNALLEIVNTLSFESLNESYLVFVNLIKALKILAFHKTSECAVLLKFLLDIFEIYGMKLYSEKCTCCGAPFHDHIYLNYNVGELVCSQCQTFQSEEISKGEYAILKILSINSYDKLPTIKYSNEIGLCLLKKLRKNFYQRFDKSLKFIGIIS